MSMTQIAFLKKAEIPNNLKIQECIKQLGYDFEITGNSDNLYELDGLECKINGHKTFFEIYSEESSEVAKENEWIKPDLTNQDTAISFVWGADFAAGACIGLISLALIDCCNALIYYIDDEMKYSREMLIADTPQFLSGLDKQVRKNISVNSIKETSSLKNAQTKKSFWLKLKDKLK